MKLLNKKTITAISASAIMTTGIGGVIIADETIDPYVTNEISFFTEATSTLKESGTNQTVLSKALPEMTINKWNGVAPLTVKVEGVSATGNRKFLSDKILWDGAGKSAQAYPLPASENMEDGGYELELIWETQPATTTFQFTFDGWEQFEFLFQPPLWVEAGLEAPTAECTDTDCDTPTGNLNRPEDIVNSWAVYHKLLSNHEEGQTNYGTGKYAHIKRLKAIDAKGDWMWIDDAHYSDGVLTGTVPLSWASNASYPVTIDPTFGYTSIGASTQGSGLARSLQDVRNVYLASNGDTVTLFSVYGRNTTAPSSWGVGVFDCPAVGGGPPVNLLGSVTSIPNTTDPLSWNDSAAVSITMVGGTAYCVGVSGNNNGNNRTAYDAGNTDETSVDNSTSLPTTWGQTSTEARRYSYYVTYTVGGSDFDDGSGFFLLF